MPSNDGSVRYNIIIDDSNVKKDMKKTEGVVSKAGRGMASAGKKAVVGITAAIGALGASALTFGAGFEQSMSQVAATMGYTSQELNDDTSDVAKNFEKLEKVALEMGSTTKFSASESAEALNFLALAGYDVEKSIETLPKVLNLATAGGLELGYTADLVTDSMSALGLESKDLDTFVDQLAKTSQKSNTSVGQLGEAILTVGGTAKTLSGGITEMNVNLGLLADNGVKASEGGTALRNMILSLSAPTDKAAAVLEELGVSTVDVDGNLRNLNEIMFDINDATKEMGSAEKAGILNKVFNKTDLKSVNALLGTTEKRVADLTKELETSEGSAKNMADTMSDNLMGTLTNMKSAFEGFSIALFKGDEDLAKKSLESLLGGLDKVIDKYIVPLITSIANALPQIVTTLINAIVKLIPKLLNAIVKTLPTLISGIIKGLVELFPALVQTFSDLIPLLAETLLLNLPILVAGVYKLATSILTTLAENIPMIVKFIPQLIESLLNTVLENIPLLLDAMVLLLTEVAKHAPTIITGILPIIPVIVTALADAILQLLPEIVKIGIILLTSLILELPTIITQIVLGIGKILFEILRVLLMFIPEIVMAGSDLMEGFWNGIKNKDGWLRSKISNFFGGVVDSIKNFFGIKSPSKLFEYFGKMNMEGFGKGFEDEEIKVSRKIGNVFEGINQHVAPIGVGGMSPTNTMNNNVVVTGNTIADDNVNTVGEEFMSKLKRDGLY